MIILYKEKKRTNTWDRNGGLHAHGMEKHRKTKIPAAGTGRVTETSANHQN